MQEKFFYDFLQELLKQNPSMETTRLLKRYIERVPALALSQEIYTALKTHEVKEVEKCHSAIR